MITIALPTRNRPHLLPVAVNSLMEQTYTNWECIIHADGTDQESLDYISTLDSRFTCLTAATPVGLPTGVACCLEKARGAYFGVLDDDDYLHPAALEKCAIGAPLVYTLYKDVYTSGRMAPGYRNGEYSRELLLRRFCLFHFRLIDTSLLRATGIDTSYPLAYDYDLTLRLTRHVEPILIPEYLYYYRVHSNSLSQDHYKQQYWARVAQVRELHQPRPAGIDRTNSIDVSGE
jgi:glycosyltransferase involved in cell wall biosynthesis